ASVNVMPMNIFEYLRLANLRNTNMLVEMADMTKKAPLGRPFLETIHAKIDVFDKEISLGTDNDRVSYDMEKKDHNFSFSIEKIFMLKYDLDNRPQSPACSNNQLRNLRDMSPDDSLQDHICKKMKIELDQHIPRTHFCNPIKQTINEQTKMWRTCDPTKGTSSQESNNLRPRYYTFREWTLIKVGHIDISEPVKKALLKLWLIDCFRDESWIIKDPLSRSFYDYKWVFDLEIDQLVDEYELVIGKKGHMLDKIWEYYKDVHRNNTYWWHDHGFEEEERDEMVIGIEKYDPPEVLVETFEVKKYSFKSGQKFICVTKEVYEALPLERQNGSRFREMI
ncbi:hypothetical protein Tco_0986807, partial [Tanacetum coccineum]